MTARFPLATAFLAAARAKGSHATDSSSASSDPSPSSASSALEAELGAVVARARTEWPGVDVSGETVAAYLGERVDHREDPVSVLRKTRTSELYLTCACAAGNEAAIVFFDTAYLGKIDASLARMKLPPSALEEAKQVLRHTLFVGQAGRPPKIGEYRGLGELKSWVRAAAVRASFRVMRRPKGQVDADAAVLGGIPASGDVELDYLKRTYGPGVGVALKAAFRRLSAEERNLLRHHFAHGLTIDDLASLYKVHRSTAARRLAAARQRLSERTREALAVHLGVHSSEVSSLVRLIESQLDVTLGSILKSGRARFPDTS